MIEEKFKGKKAIDIEKNKTMKRDNTGEGI